MIDQKRPPIRDRTGLAGNRRWFLGAAVATAAAIGTPPYRRGPASAAADESEAAWEDVAPDEADTGFLTDMAFHHAQALAMCQRVLGRETGGEVQAAAAEILQNQSYERGLMHAWLQVWGASTAPPTEVMAWMGMPLPAEAMIGLASAEEMTDLAAADGLAKGRLFLELMRTHHIGGIQMAEAAGAARTKQVRRLAIQMAANQTYEIEVFDQLLATTYAQA